MLFDPKLHEELKNDRERRKDLVPYEYIKQVHDKYEEWLKGVS